MFDGVEQVFAVDEVDDCDGRGGEMEEEPVIGANPLPQDLVAGAQTDALLRYPSTRAVARSRRRRSRDGYFFSIKVRELLSHPAFPSPVLFVVLYVAPPGSGARLNSMESALGCQPSMETCVPSSSVAFPTPRRRTSGVSPGAHRICAVSAFPFHVPV